MPPAPSNIKVVIENKLYDLTLWAHKHPGGVKILEDFNDNDCTDHFFAVHSNKAREMLKNLKSTELPKEQRIEPTKHFKLMKRFEEAGYMKPNYICESLGVIHITLLCLLSLYLSDEHPFFAMLCLAAAKVQGGWVAHTMDHSRDSPMKKIGQFFSNIFLGFTSSWWAEKHTRHHLCTNEVENDTDIQMDPLIFLYKPLKKTDAWNRKFQHLYFTALYSLLFFAWEWHSIKSVFSKKLYKDTAFLVLHYMWYYTLGWKICITGLLLSGTITCWVVTANHQAEEKLYDRKGLVTKKGENGSVYQINDYAVQQLTTTRNIAIDNWFVSYCCGGMQFQIEHHLFPRIPLYRLSEVKPLIKQWCKENSYEYKEESFWEITKRNYNNIEFHAGLPLSM
jgi:fatty acid desaturase